MARSLASAVQGGMGMPAGLKTYSPFPFAGLNVQDSPMAIGDQEFPFLLNWLRIGSGRLRTAWDVGPSLYTAPTGRTIVSFFFYTIGTSYYVAVFLSDGSAIQVNAVTGVRTTIGGPGNFYHAGGSLPACAQWGTLYLLISNRNTTNDYWAWDGSILYKAGTAAPDGVTLLSTGEDYNTAPTITPFGGHGTGMQFDVTVDAGGVVQVRITDPGNGYEVGDLVQLAFSGGGSDNSAILAANLNAGGVSAASITAAGSGYTSPVVAFSGGGGSGAAATATAGTGVASVAVTAGGSGYTAATVAFSGGGGSGAIATASIVGGAIVAVTINSPGSGYATAPTVAISGDGTGATATATIQDGGIIAITITSPGTGYTSAPTVTITDGGPGTGATAVAVLGGASVDGVTVVNGGTGFLFPPVLSFAGGGGTGASGVAVLASTSIAKINVVNPGSNYEFTPDVVISPGSGPGSGATATAVLYQGQVVGVTVTNGGSGYTGDVQVFIQPYSKEKTGSGASAVAVFQPVPIASVQMTNYGLNYTDAPTVYVTPGANRSAYANVTLMPFGISGDSLETFQSRVIICNPKPEPWVVLPPGGDFAMSAPGSFTDFATSDGAVLFSNSDGFLQTKYVGVRQSNGYLYFLADGSISVVSSIQTQGSPATTTFNYQNVDPQGGLSWRDSRQDFGRTLIVANETGVYGLYGGALTKISSKLDQLFADALFPPDGRAITPTGATATLFNIKHYLMLMTVIDPDTGGPQNVMITWNERDWVLTQQSVALTYIGAQKVESRFTAWGTNGTDLYPLFEVPSPTLVKRLDTKLYGNDTPFLIKDLMNVYLQGQDRSAGQAGFQGIAEFAMSGLAMQMQGDESVESQVIDVLIAQPDFPAAPPFFPIWGAGTEGLPFMLVQMRLQTEAPDFVLSNLILTYKADQAAM